MNLRSLAWLVAGAATLLAAGWSLHTPSAAAADAVTARLQHLEDREQILELMNAYGATLDRRDFAAFGRLFAADADYGSGPNATHGRTAIAAQLEQVITANPSHLPEPNTHLYFDPSIQVDGDHATARSKGAYTVTNSETGVTQLVFFTAYDDTFIRHDGHWLFQRRVIRSTAR